MACPLHLVLLELEPEGKFFLVFLIVLLLLLARDKANSRQHHTRKGVRSENG